MSPDKTLEVTRILRTMVGRLPQESLEKYLLSKHFMAFCQRHDLEDAWKEYLELSRDEPELYSTGTMDHALTHFLAHVLHRYPAEFPVLFSLFLSDFSHRIFRKIPVGDYKHDLVLLGYSSGEIDTVFSPMENVSHRHSREKMT